MDGQKETLAQILKGEYVGIDSYQNYLNRLHDPAIRQDLERHEQDLRDMVTELESHLRDNYGKAAEDAGMMGRMAEFQNQIRLMGDPDDSRILAVMYDGMRMGVEQTEAELPKLEGEARRIVSKHLQRNRRILEEVDHYRKQMH